MGFNIPENSSIPVSRIQNDVKEELPRSNPWLPASLIRSVCVGLGNQIYDFYRVMKRGIDEMLPTVNPSFWGWLKGMTPYTPAKASGNAIFSGTAGSSIPIGSVVVFGDLEYETQSAATLASTNFNTSFISQTGTVARVISATDHNLGGGMTITISGGTGADAVWNGVWTNINVIGPVIFEFDVGPVFSGPSTASTLTVTVTKAVVPIEASANGANYNLDSNSVLNTQSTIPGVNTEVYVDDSGITGGTDAESEEDYSDRVVERWQNPHTPGNPSEIEAAIKGIPGNTRVWVRRIWNDDTSSVEAGCATAYFVRDDDDTTIIPDASEEAAAKAVVLDLFSANTDENDIFVVGPTAVPQTIVITGIVPATVTMATAVENQIDSFFRTETNEGDGLVIENLKSAIFQTYDQETDERLQEMTLVSPSSDVSGVVGELTTVDSISVSV
jgi:hypothetical protein